MYDALNAANMPDKETKQNFFDFKFQIKIFADTIPVTVVPMLDPSVSGNMRSSVTKPMPTKGVKVLVNTLELCTTMVNTHPSLNCTNLTIDVRV